MQKSFHLNELEALKTKGGIFLLGLVALMRLLAFIKNKKVEKKINEDTDNHPRYLTHYSQYHFLLSAFSLKFI